jgi:RNA polymerase sigma factor (sigma-70 family)
MKKYSDQEIINHLRDRNGDAVKYVIKKYMPMIKYMAASYKYSDGNLLLTGSEEDGEDVFQEALYIIMKKIDSDELKLTAKFSTFMYAVSKNLLKLKLKKRLANERYKKELKAEFDPIEEPSIHYDKNKKREIFEHYFLKLSPVCKKILKLSWKDHSNIEIAENLGNTVKYITKRKHECKKRFIELIKNNPDNI